MTIKGKTAADRIKIARGSGRPTAIEYIEYIFDDFFCLSGDRLHGEDASITGGVAFLNGSAVTVIGHQKGRDLEENVKCRFGMPSPEGYRKTQRLMKQTPSATWAAF